MWTADSYAISADSTLATADGAIRSRSTPFGRRFQHDGIVINIDEDDEELLMMLAAAVPLLNRRHA